MMLNIRQKLKQLRKPSLQRRFLFRVLVPPFVALLVISLVGFWQLDSMARQSASNDLKRASATTAAKLDREFALRQTVLKSTGNELFSVKNKYQGEREQLAKDRSACRLFVQKNTDFAQAPGNACRPFLAQFAIANLSSGSLQQVVEKSYEEQLAELGTREKDAISQRLDAFVEVFPETSALVVADEKGKPLSQATSDKNQKTTDTLIGMAAEALKKPIEARFFDKGQQRQLVFAYPITKGAVLASYNLDHSNFLRPSWQSAPIDQSKAYAVVADTSGKASYPKLASDALYRSTLNAKNTTSSAVFTSSGIEYISVVDPIGTSGWSVVVGMPAVTALEPLMIAQIATVGIIGLLLVTFLWVGALFVHRTIGSILTLVGGSLLFASGDLNYRIDTTRMGDEEFERLAKVMNDMAARIQEAETQIEQKNKEFISVATHEIKAPMTAIIGNLSMIVDDDMGKQDKLARALTTKAYQGTVRLRDLVNDLLDIARLESGRARFSLENLNLGAEIRTMIELQELPAKEKGVVISYQISDQLPLIIADKRKLEIILTNFISNAIKYNRPSGTVAVSCEVNDKFVLTTITDTGLGIPFDQQEKMFQKFFRVDTIDRKDIPGTGLGMYITKQFIEAMGGQLWFESEAEKGTSFHFTLPKAE
jgi:signal transduction histidine kinase